MRGLGRGALLDTYHAEREPIAANLLKETAQREPKYGFLDPGPIGSLYEAAIGWSTPSNELRADREGVSVERAIWE